MKLLSSHFFATVLAFTPCLASQEMSPQQESTDDFLKAIFSSDSSITDDERRLLFQEITGLSFIAYQPSMDAISTVDNVLDYITTFNTLINQKIGMELIGEFFPNAHAAVEALKNLLKALEMTSKDANPELNESKELQAFIQFIESQLSEMEELFKKAAMD